MLAELQQSAHDAKGNLGAVGALGSDVDRVGVFQAGIGLAAAKVFDQLLGAFPHGVFVPRLTAADQTDAQDEE